MKQISVIDTRHPFTSMLEVWKQEGMSSQEDKKIREDLSEFVSQVAEQFVGFQSHKSIQKSLAIALGIISLGLLHATSGKVDFKKWIKLVQEKGLQEIVTDVVVYIKQIPCLQFTFFCTEQDKSSDYDRELLIRFATEFNDQGTWAGYTEMCQYVSRVNRHLEEKALALWLMEHVLKQSLNKFKLINTEEYEGKESFNFSYDAVNNSILFKYCFEIPLEGRLTISQRAFNRVVQSSRKKGSSVMVKARKQYQALMSQIPTELHGALFCEGKDWDSRFLKGSINKKGYQEYLEIEQSLP